GAAGQREVVPEQWPAEQLVKAEDNVPRDHPVDPQLPAGRRDFRQDDGGVYPVERRAWGDKGTETPDLEIGARRQRRGWLRGGGNPQRPLRGRHALAARHEG